MIPNLWYAVLDSREVRPGRPVGVTRLGERLVFWRDAAGRVACARDRCPHRGAALSLGKVCDGDLACPFHGFQFDPAGRCTFVPAHGRGGVVPQALAARSYPVWEGHGFIFLWWGDSEPEPAEPPWFSDLDGEWTVSIMRDRWRTHYTRALENQLDVAHLPFVHHNTIGRGGRTVVDGPWVEWLDPNRFRVYMRNRQDDGTPPKRSHDTPRPDRPFWLELILPNVWQNHLGDDVRLVAAFAPVDNENTVLYVQFYQRFVRLPVLRTLVAWLAVPLNRYIVHQDKQVVESQRPQRSELRLGEILVPADKPIIEYRRRRDELMNPERRNAHA